MAERARVLRKMDKRKRRVFSIARFLKALAVFVVLGAALFLTACGKLPADSGDAVPSMQTTQATPDKGEEPMKPCDFSVFPNVSVTGLDLSALDDAQRAVLCVQDRYCQAMTDADIDTMRELVSEDMVYVHMSGMRQTREEYFADVADGSLRYYTIGIESPVVRVDGSKASITYTSVLNANAYDARGTFRMKGTHHYELRGGRWTLVNGR